jgi:hypothetical protein
MQPQHRPTSSATFHPAEKPGQNNTEEVFDDEEPSPEDEDDLIQAPAGLADQPNIDMDEGDLGSGSLEENRVDHQMPPES